MANPVARFMDQRARARELQLHVAQTLGQRPLSVDAQRVLLRSIGLAIPPPAELESPSATWKQNATRELRRRHPGRSVAGAAMEHDEFYGQGFPFCWNGQDGILEWVDSVLAWMNSRLSAGAEPLTHRDLGLADKALFQATQVLDELVPQPPEDPASSPAIALPRRRRR